MKQETQVIGDCAVHRLEKLLADVERETVAVSQQNDIPTAVVHYHAFKELIASLRMRLNALQAHADTLDYEILPTMFDNQGVKTITVDDVGRVSINLRWKASMLDKERSMAWLKETGNGGIIQETVPWQTLTAFAKAEVLARRPLPEDLFRVGTAPHVSITPPRVEAPTDD